MSILLILFKNLTILSDCKINKFPNSIRQLHLFANVLFSELPYIITHLTIGKELKKKSINIQKN
jgi:hypothetical protein